MQNNIMLEQSATAIVQIVQGQISQVLAGSSGARQQTLWVRSSPAV